MGDSSLQRTGPHQGFPNSVQVNWTHIGMEMNLKDCPGLPGASPRSPNTWVDPLSGFLGVLLGHFSQAAEPVPLEVGGSAPDPRCSFGVRATVPRAWISRSKFHFLLAYMFLPKYSEKCLHSAMLYLKHSLSPCHINCLGSASKMPITSQFCSRSRATKKTVITGNDSYKQLPLLQKSTVYNQFHNLWNKTAIPWRKAVMQFRRWRSWPSLVSIQNETEP